MCHLVRDEHAMPQAEGGALPGSESRRPRWAAGAAVALASGLALAAWIDAPQAPTAKPPVQQQAAAVVAPQVAAVRAAAGSTEGVKLVDDEVPTAPGELRAAGGNCHHGM